MAIVAVAVNDAVNTISRRYATYGVVTLPPGYRSMQQLPERHTAR